MAIIYIFVKFMNTKNTHPVPLRQEVIVKFWPVAAFVLVIFVSLDFFVLKDYLVGWIHLGNLLFLILSMPLILKSKNVVLASNILPLLGLLTLMPFIFTGGPANTGFWWSIVYVIGCFLVTDKKWAIIWLTLYFSLTIVIMSFSIIGIVKIAYSIPELLNLLFAYIITFIFVYLFNQVREYYLQLANNKAEELSRVNKELLSANNDIEQFVYLASHDLQEPLRTISNFVGLVDEKVAGKMDKDTDQYLEFIVSATSKMQGLIKDLLDLSRIGRNIRFVKIDSNEVLKEVIAEMDATIKESKANISFSGLPVLKGCKIEMKRLFQNLISNAIKFQAKGNTPEIVITAEQKKSEYIFAIRDNGIGIEEQFIYKIFVIFQRLHNDTEYPGTGIGLAICKKIVHLHGGDIWVKSKLGEGSTFYFSISKEI